MTKLHSAVRSKIHKPFVQHLGKNRQHWVPFKITPEPTPEKLEEIVRNIRKRGGEAVSCGIQGGHAIVAVEPGRHDSDDLDAIVQISAQGTTQT